MMQIVLKPRQSGKTMDMIKAADGHDGYIVCISHQEAVRVSRLAREWGYEINFPLTIDEFVHGSYPIKTSLYLDNADMLLQSIAKVPIKAITLTKEEG